MTRNSMVGWMATCIVVVVVAATGCTDIDSENLTTQGMWAEVVVSDDASGSTATVSVVLKPGGRTSATYVELQGDDRLSATFDGDTAELGESTFFDLHTYAVTFDRAPADGDFVVALERAVDDGAPNTVVQLPPTYTMDTIADIRRGVDDLVVRWSNPTPDPMNLRISGDCIEAFDQGVDGDVGSFAVPAAALVGRADAGSRCELTVTLTRAREGDLDPNYGEGGVATGHRVRSVVVDADL